MVAFGQVLSVVIRYTGDTSGTEVVQLYVTPSGGGGSTEQ